MHDYMLNLEKYEYGNNVTGERSHSGLLPTSTLDKCVSYVIVTLFFVKMINLPFENLPYVAT